MWKFVDVMLLVSLIVVGPGWTDESDYLRQDCCAPCHDGIVDTMLERVEDMPQLAERSEILFVGRVTRAELSACCDGYADVTFRVRKSWKGSQEPVITVRTEAPCGEPFPFAIGAEYIVSSSLPQGSGRNGLLSEFFTPLEAAEAFRYELALDTWRKERITAECEKNE